MDYLGKRMKKTWVESIYISGPTTFLDEIDLEYQENNQTLLICPIVLMYMLDVLANYRLGNLPRCLMLLKHLQELFFYDGGIYID